jgi:hypothetical protein
MIIKSKSIQSRYGIRKAVEYLFKEEKEYTILHTRFLLRNANIERITEAFEKNEDKRIRRRKDSVVLFHDFISFHKNDSHKLEDDVFLKKVAKKYAKMREQSITVCVLHRERDHIHLHVMASGCRLDGKSARISKAEFQKKKLELERFQERELHLVHSRVVHEKKSVDSSLNKLDKRSNEVGESPKNKSFPRK